ncbi:11968_t:CDS:2 [Diversispora eburnea]|uniref:11968_t:CDS:1 n=1 Tax=Diversispora eburnea TaxID=1213867 RepID=A0A9N9CH52_9GLOM|nr:11968_t:CDS:2 [Diversispora eburnea]
MTSALKKQQKSISDLSEIVKYLAYDIREVRDGTARSSNVRSNTSKSPQNYTSTIFELWEDIDALFKEKKTHEKQSMARLYPKVTEKIWDLVIKHKKGIAISDTTVRNFHKKITKNLKEDTLDSLKLWVSKQKGEIDSEPKSWS